VRVEGRGLRRRDVVMLLDSAGRLEWEWEPIRKREVLRRLQRSGEHTTDIYALIQAADADSPG
jgi:hypothetical protein